MDHGHAGVRSVSSRSTSPCWRRALRRLLAAVVLPPLAVVMTAQCSSGYSKPEESPPGSTNILPVVIFSEILQISPQIPGGSGPRSAPGRRVRYRPAAIWSSPAAGSFPGPHTGVQRPAPNRKRIGRNMVQPQRQAGVAAGKAIQNDGGGRTGSFSASTPASGNRKAQPGARVPSSSRAVTSCFLLPAGVVQALLQVHPFGKQQQPLPPVGERLLPAGHSSPAYRSAAGRHTALQQLDILPEGFFTQRPLLWAQPGKLFLSAGRPARRGGTAAPALG